MDSRQKKEVHFRSTQVGEHARIRDKTQSAGDIVAVGVAHFYAALSLSGFAGRPHPTHRAPNPFDQPPLSFNCQLRCLFVSPRCRLNVAPGKSLGGRRIGTGRGQNTNGVILLGICATLCGDYLRGLPDILTPASGKFAIR